jgi:anaerobic magnesium-protoporphyrin IX monomethyl ester cyclase
MKKKEIDCLIVGHYEPEFEHRNSLVKNSSKDLYFSQFLNSEYFKYKGKLYTAEGVFNHFKFQRNRHSFFPLNSSNVFSNTIAYLGTVLEKNDITFDFISPFSFNDKSLLKKNAGTTFKTIAITTTYYFSENPILNIIQFLKKQQPTASFIVGGPFLSMNIRKKDNNQELFSRIGADFYIHNPEGERSLCLLINAIKFNRSLLQVPNLFYFHKKRWKYTFDSLEINSLESNLVRWDHFKRVPSSAAVRTSKSCPFACAFCNYPLHAGKYQFSSVEAVESEIAKLHSLQKVNSIVFVDDTFNVPLPRFKKILTMMIRKKFSFKWACYLRCQFIDEEAAMLMKESGCTLAFLGIESGNNTVLNNMNKRVTVEEYFKGIALLNKYDIHSIVSYIIGFPGETPKTVKDTIDFINEAQPTFYRGMIWYCDTRAPVYKMREKFNIKGYAYDWSHCTMDSKTAAALDKEMLFKVSKSIWCRHYDLDALVSFLLLTRGFSVEWVKAFLSIYSDCIKEKLTFPTKPEISDSSFQKFAGLKYCS